MQLDTPLWLAAASGGLAYCMHDYLRKWMLSTQKVKHAVVLDLIANVPQLFLLVFFYWQGSLKLVNALWVVALTFLPAVFFGIIWLKPGRPVFANMKDAGAVHWPHARWTLSSAFLQWSAGNYFVLAAGWWLGNAALGALRLAQYMFGLLNVLLQALEHYALPKAAQLHHDRKALFLFLRRQVMQAALAILPVVALMVLGRNYLMQFSGGQAFTPYSFVFAGLGVLYCIIILGYGVRLAMRALLLNKFYFIGYLLSTIFSVSSARFLVSHYELGGIMAGMVMAQLILVVFWMFCLIQKNNLTWKSFTWYLAK
jgi:hypothetical protein